MATGIYWPIPVKYWPLGTVARHDSISSDKAIPEIRWWARISVAAHLRAKCLRLMTERSLWIVLSYIQHSLFLSPLVPRMEILENEKILDPPLVICMNRTAGQHAAKSVATKFVASVSPNIVRTRRPSLSACPLDFIGGPDLKKECRIFLSSRKNRWTAGESL